MPPPVLRFQTPAHVAPVLGFTSTRAMLLVAYVYLLTLTDEPLQSVADAESPWPICW